MAGTQIRGATSLTKSEIGAYIPIVGIDPARPAAGRGEEAVLFETLLITTCRASLRQRQIFYLNRS
jgi:hypothetical protein